MTKKKAISKGRPELPKPEKLAPVTVFVKTKNIAAAKSAMIALALRYR